MVAVKIDGNAFLIDDFICRCSLDELLCTRDHIQSMVLAELEEFLPVYAVNDEGELINGRFSRSSYLAQLLLSICWAFSSG